MNKKGVSTAIMAGAAAVGVMFIGPGDDGVEYINLGNPTTIDADTLYGAPNSEGIVAKIRMHGIDAPEKYQDCFDGFGYEYECGQKAKEALKNKIGDNSVQCEIKDRDRYGRIVGECFVERDSQSLNAWLVSEGWAFAYTAYSDDYVQYEKSAKKYRLGVHSGPHMKPWDYRRGHRVKRTDSCQIKGNISRWRGSSSDYDVSSAVRPECAAREGVVNGCRIYHVPGGRFYNRTKITPRADGTGERWFCSEKRAERAGWRKSSS